MKAQKSSVVSLAVLLATAASAQAQQTSTRNCGGRDPVGYIGISGIACNCTISSPGSGQEWRFRTEPKITSLEMDSRAASVLKTGDIITAVNEKLITTREGAQEFANIKPGVPVILTLRRKGQLLKVALTPESVCPNDDRLTGIYAPMAAPALAPPGAYVAATPGVAAARTPNPEIASAPRAWVGRMPTAIAYSSLTPRATFGMGLSCSSCAMTFSEKEKTALMTFTRPPEVYSIERGGPADRAGIRRGDLITHINDRPIDSYEGGKLFSTAKPGQIVRFTVVRDNQRKTYSVKAASRSNTPSVLPPPELAQSSEALERARESLAHLQRAQQEQLMRLQSDVRRTHEMQEQQLRAAQRTMLREEQEHRQRLEQLSREMARAQTQMRAAIVDSARAMCATPSPRAYTLSATRTLRYTGTLGNADIEVRGANPVSVTEDGDEIVITTGATVVRVQKKK